MIPIELLKRVSTIKVHADCHDGIASAMILKDAFRMIGMSPPIEFLVHNTLEHRAASMGEQDGFALWCDIAPHASGLLAMVPGELRFIVLDHHKSADYITRSFGELGVFADEKLEPGVSGAMLAFREVWEQAWNESLPQGLPTHTQYCVRDEVRDFAECIGAYDTWQTVSSDMKFTRGRWMAALLMSKPASYWLEGADDEPQTCIHPPYFAWDEIRIGRALFEAHQNTVGQAALQRVYYEVRSWTSATGLPSAEVGLHVFQDRAVGPRLINDVAEAVRAPRPAHLAAEIIAGFAYVINEVNGPPGLKYSLRVLSGDFDVSAFAKANGGGGHTRAASFTIPLRNELGTGPKILDPYDEVRTLLKMFLHQNSILPPMDMT